MPSVGLLSVGVVPGESWGGRDVNSWLRFSTLRGRGAGGVTRATRWEGVGRQHLASARSVVMLHLRLFAICGVKGLGICLARSAFQLTPLKNGWAMISCRQGEGEP